MQQQGVEVGIEGKDSNSDTHIGDKKVAIEVEERYVVGF